MEWFFLEFGTGWPGLRGAPLRRNAKDGDEEEIGFDRFLKLAADYGALNDNPQCCMFDQQGVRVPMPLFQRFVP